MISARGLGKRYQIGAGPAESHRTLRDEIARLAFRRKSNPASRASREFWAVRDVSFEVAEGEVLGIIGRNGAGKSTLLKILSRIVRPTEGEAQLKGRLGSLLEVGTGFHPELTGRENVFMNAAILGMRRNEVLKKFDEIVEFAELGAFLDTPVKRYSSGMYVRLAFAVAAHLEPEILIVDEVLAVGDMAFQKKCLGRMSEVSKQGRTVLFVSHNMGAVSSLCSRAILLEQGRVSFDGPTHEAISRYATGGTTAEASCELPALDVPVQVVRMALKTSDGLPCVEASIGGDVELWAEYEIRQPVRETYLAVQISKAGMPLLYSYESDLHDELRGDRERGLYRCRLRLPTSILKEGFYEVSLHVGVGRENITDQRASISFNIVNHREDTTFKAYRADRPGVLYNPLEWKTARVSEQALQL